jgi:hypothetical protein
MDYEDRLIIYIDILGFSDFVNYTSQTRVNSSEKINKIDNLLKMIKDFFNDKHHILQLSKSRQATSFSDLIVISTSIEDIDYMDSEIYDVFYLLLNATIKGFLLRGSIVYGKLIHTKDVIFGPGLIDAYNREKSVAKYPRIIIDDVIVADLNDLLQKSQNAICCENIISRDTDGIYYLDFLKSVRDEVDNFREYAMFLSSFCDILIGMIDNPSINEKYIWLKDKFIKHINMYSKLFDYSFDNKDVTKEDLDIFKMILYEYKDKSFKNKQ